jgi:hypothetical protein
MAASIIAADVASAQLLQQPHTPENVITPSYFLYWV